MLEETNIKDTRQLISYMMEKINGIKIRQELYK